MKTRVEIAALHKRLGKTMVYVTHDQVEAMTLADKIVVLRDGVVEQVGKPLDLYNAPANVFVAGFIGSPAMNFIAAAKLPSGIANTGRVTTIGIRPEHLVRQSGGHVAGVVTAIERLGATAYVYLQVGEQTLCAQLAEADDIHVGMPIAFGVAPVHVHRFDEAGRRIV